jgi:hypothetical protein
MNDPLGNIRYALEIAAFDEKIALAKLEVSKAQERVQELQFDKTRFTMSILTLQAQALERAQGGCQASAGSTIVEKVIPTNSL